MTSDIYQRYQIGSDQPLPVGSRGKSFALPHDDSPEIAFVRSRAESLDIDTAGRLPWLEAAWSMIQSAKKSRNEAL